MDNHLRFYKGEKETLILDGFAYSFAQDLKNYSGWKKNYKCARGCKCRARIWTTGEWQEDDHGRQYQRGIVISSEHNHKPEKSDKDGAAQTGKENATGSKIEQEKEQSKSVNLVENSTQTIENQREEESPQKIVRQKTGVNLRFYKGEKGCLYREGFAYTFAQDLKNYSGWKTAYKCASGWQCRARIWTTGEWEEDAQSRIFQHGFVITAEHNHGREKAMIIDGEEEEMDAEDEKATPSIVSLEDSSEEDETHQSKSLKDLAKRAKHLAVKRRTKKRKLNTESSESGTGEDSDDEEGAASFESEDDSDVRFSFKNSDRETVVVIST
ncbi:hypothetical protein Ddc_22261 [Ditylenchus destructor]|nr:hypothetical protein Ddc_22261 [Ditylenchus destructor]